MRRGTTPTHRFSVDLDLTSADEIYLTYRQGCKTLEKTKDDLTVTPEVVEVALSQEETLLFCDKEKILIQFRVKFPDQTTVASNIIQTTIGEILKEGVI